MERPVFVEPRRGPCNQKAGPRAASKAPRRKRQCRPRSRFLTTARETQNERIFRFVRLESVACEPCAGARRRRGRSALALAEGLCLRPVPARAALHAWARTEM